MVKYLRLVFVLFAITVFLGGVCFFASEKIKKNNSEKVLFEKVGKILEKRKEETTGTLIAETQDLSVFDDSESLEDGKENLEPAKEQKAEDAVATAAATDSDAKTEQLDTEEPTTEEEVVINSKAYLEKITIKTAEASPFFSLRDNVEIVVKKGSAFYLKAQVKPKDATDVKIVWKSDNEEVVSVLEDGKVCAKKCGAATITASAAGSEDIKDSIVIKVEQIERKDATLVAHRGKCDDAPENSLAAIELALQEGYVNVEFDVWETSDHQFVVSHDQSLKNSCDKDVNVTDITLAEAMQYQIVNGNKVDQYSDETIPSLDMVLDMAQNYEGRLHIELKEALSKKQLRKLRKMLGQYGLEDRVKIITFSEENIRKMRALDSEGMTPVQLEYLSFEWNKDVYNLCKQCHADIGLNYEVITPKIIEKCHNKGIAVNAWTVNDFETARQLVYNLGVDIITSDYFLID